MIAPQWMKVINDLWDNKARTILVIIAIAVGVFAFGGVFMARDVIINDMQSQYAAINPSSITLSVSSFNEDLVHAARGMRNVADAAGSTAMSVKLITPDGPVNLILNAVEDYSDITVNQITPLDVRWPPGRRQIMLERASVELAGAAPGDTLTLELADGQQRDLTYIGDVHDLNAFPATMWPQLTGYVTMDTLRWLGASGLYSELNIVTYPEVTTRAETEQIGNDIKERIEHYGYTVYSVNPIRPGEHWAEEVTKGVILILSVLGTFALALSAFLVVNTITALLTQHKQQIGVMKAIGATRSQVIRYYLALVASFGVLALLLALPLGAGLAYITVSAVTGFINLDIVNFHMPIWVLLLMAGASLVAPLAAALVPVLGSARVTVRETLDDFGIGNKTSAGLIDRAINRVRGLPRPVMISLRNTFRRKGRLLLTLGTLTLAGAMFISVLNVRQAMFNELDRALLLWGYDVEFSLNGDYSVRSIEREAARIPDVDSVEGVSIAGSRLIREDRSEGSNVYLVGIAPQSRFAQGSSLVENGRWLEPGDQNAVVLSSEVAKNEPGLQVGDEIWLKIGEQERKWRVVGFVNTLGDTTGYVNFDYLSRIKGTPARANRIFVGTVAHDPDTQDQVALDLEDRLKRAGLGVGYTETGHVIVESNASQFDFLVAFLLGAAVILAVVGGLGLTGTMSLNVLERTREIGVMRSIGAPTWSVRSIVIVEGLVIGGISWVLGTLISVPLTAGFGYALGAAVFGFPLSYTFRPEAALIWLPLLLALAVTSSLLPAQRAARISIREALSYE